MVINKKMILIILCIGTQVIYSQKKKRDVIDPIKDLPTNISKKYGEDIIKNKKMALEYVDVILKNNYPNVQFDSLKPYEINLIGNDRVWEIKVLRKANYYYHLRINKNNGEILNFWVDK